MTCGGREGKESMRKKTGWIAAAVLMLCLPLFAWAETARVVTPGGKLHIRKMADEKGKIVIDVPNKSLVEAEEVGETWSRITYKKKTGYVKTDYLRLPSRAVGKTLYADEGTLFLRSAPRADAAILLPVGPLTAVEVLSAENGWLKVRCGETEGFTEADRFTYQWDRPAGSLAWVREKGVLNAAATLRVGPDPGSAVLEELSAGQSIDVTVIQGDFCLVRGEKGYGFAPVSAVCLTGPVDSGQQTGSVSPASAAEAAAAALKKSFKTFAKAELYSQVAVAGGDAGLGGPVYWCGFFSEGDQYLYAAWVNAENKQALLTASYAGFAAPVKESSLLPAGEMTLEISAEALRVGDVLDVTVRAWEGSACRYTLKKNGQDLAATEPVKRFFASFRPREAGDYSVTVLATDAAGNTASMEKAFRVEGEKGASGLSKIYSQKDGWWDAVAYRKSTMAQSGCAVFALSHALHRMGITDERTLPENLAKAYAMCLTPEGTNNERLISSAAKDFGFTTKRQLIKDQKEIVKLLREGAFFSFRVARGHIAMISGLSEDGAMMRVVDSAPSATIERIIKVSMYYQTRGGGFRKAVSLEEIPGARWYLDTNEWGGLEYWMPVSYGAKLGVRLIQPAGK